MFVIEDILHHLVDTIGVESADNQILTSISRQCKKGIALTDRQYDLVKTRLASYREKLSEYQINFDDDIPTRMPLRYLDRRKTIKIVDQLDTTFVRPHESYKKNWKWIEIRFPFSKKHILLIEKITSSFRKTYVHEKGSHKHFFKLTELSIEFIIDQFKDKNFDIDDILIEYYNEIKAIRDSKESYLPHYNNKFLNVPTNVLETIDQEIGEINKNNIVKLIDRQLRYGIKVINPSASGVKGVIALRNNAMIALSPQEYSMNQIAEALLHLDRFPILVVVDSNKELEQVSNFYNIFNGIVPNNKQTVLFRVENNNEKYNLNNYIHDKVLNNWLDKDTEIVYISKTKLPKLLLKTDWKPMAVIYITGQRPISGVSVYANDVSDLIIYHDDSTGIINEMGLRRGYL